MQTMLSRRLAALILAQAQGQGFLSSSMPGVVLMRMDRSLPRAPTVYEPCVVIVAQGRKVATFNGRQYFSDVNQCLTLNLPLPIESETSGTVEQPFLALAVAVTPELVTELLLRMDTPPAEPAWSAAMSSVPISVDLLSAAVRLLETLGDDERARVLGPGIVRELVYLLLGSSAGQGLRTLAVGDGRMNRIGKVLRRLQTDYALDHDMTTLARDAGMSSSTFHARFRAATGESPLQYLKLIRLHKARGLMVNAGLSVQETAARVGYESVSQFSREFKRLFGDSPTAAAAQLRTRLNEEFRSRLRTTLSFGDQDR